MIERKTWIGTPPATCDICHRAISTVFYDSKMRQGQWANVCHTCFTAHCIGVGTGKGQKYVKQSDGMFLKTGGQYA